MCRMARILHLVASNHRRGAETFAVELADHLRRVGHQVRVMAVADSGAAEPLPVEVAAARRFDPRGMARTVGAARWADVVVSFGSNSLMAGAVAARLTRRPFVYRQIGDPSVWGRVRASNLRIGAPARAAARIVALYPAAAETLVTLYGLDRDRIRVIPRGVPAERFAPATDEDRRTACEQLGLDPDRVWVAYVGSLSEEKDPLLAVEAMAHLRAEVGLLIAGDGPLRPDVEHRAAPYGDRIRLLGTVGDVRPVLRAASLLVLPSRTEGVPGAAVEAGLCGLPVVAFDVGGVGSVVIDHGTGRAIDDRDPSVFAAAILDAEANRTDYGQSARTHCLERFSMRSVGREWERLIDELSEVGLDSSDDVPSHLDHR